MGRRFVLKYHPLVLAQDLSKIDSANKSRIKSAIKEKLILAPEIFGRPLRKTLKGNRKLRVGDYRIIFKLKENIIKILIIGHRSEVYREALKRLS